MGVVLPFPGPGSRPRRDPEPGTDAASRAEGAEPVGWAIPGVDPAVASDDGVDADEPVALPAKASRRAENVAIAALTSYDASEAELRARLARKGLEQEAIDAELARLRRAGLVDDAALAERLIERLRDHKGLGDGALRAALRQRQIPSELVDAALASSVEDEQVVHDRLHEVAADRARRLGGLAPEVAERRLLAYLQRKGYSGSDAREAARAALRPL